MNNMRRSRPSRSVAALIALFSLLFMQLAVASYACPGLQPGQGAAPAAMAHPADAGSMPGCTGMPVDIEQPGLCHAQDQAGNQSLDKPGSPQVPPFVGVVLAHAVVVIDPAIHTAPIQPLSSVRERVADPPLAILNCCFRI
jgi:hypothetical protein